MFAPHETPTMRDNLNPHSFLTPADYVTIDIETGDAPEHAIERALMNWTPPSNVKDAAKIEARRQEAAGKIREKAALLDASPILCVCLKTDRVALALNGMDAESHPIEGWQVVPCGDERSMLLALRDWMNASTNPDTRIIGHNVRSFDLPKLRAAYVRHRLKLPAILMAWRDDVEIVDTMSLFKSFSMESRDNPFVSLDSVCSALDVPRPKGIINGGHVPQLYREGEYHNILVYCAIDTAATERAFLLMTSAAPDLE